MYPNMMNNTYMMLKTKDRIQIMPFEMLDNLDVTRRQNWIGHNTAAIQYMKHRCQERYTIH